VSLNETFARSLREVAVIDSSLTLFLSQSAISMKYAMWAKIYLIQLGSSVECLFRSWLLSSVACTCTKNVHTTCECILFQSIRCQKSHCSWFH